MGRLSAWTIFALVVLAFAANTQDVRADVPSENECRPYIEKALHDLKGDIIEDETVNVSEENNSTNEQTDDISTESDAEPAAEESAEIDNSGVSSEDEAQASVEDNANGNEDNEHEEQSIEDVDGDADSDNTREKRSIDVESEDADDVSESTDDNDHSKEDDNNKDSEENAQEVDVHEVEEVDITEVEASDDSKENPDTDDNNDDDVQETSQEADASEEENAQDENTVNADVENIEEPSQTEHQSESNEEQPEESNEAEDVNNESSNESREKRDLDEDAGNESHEDIVEGEEKTDIDESHDEGVDDVNSQTQEDEVVDDTKDVTESENEVSEVTKPIESFPEDDLLIEYNIPTNLRDHSHVTELLRLDEEFDEKEAAINKVSDVILKDLKKIYETAIKPLENLYKYRDLSNRHFGDPEIFSKPLVLFMGPWSGGKSTILNYLTENEHTVDSLRTGAEPSPAYFNILMHGEKPEVLDGTQMAADWTFSGLQKFGQGLEERLRGQKLPHKLLEKVNIVEIPGILEVRKQVSHLFPFNDACQWFIDRADIIFLVYDPSKLDVGPETEAILDQLKGREYQTRILLNKADLVKPEELLRVQGALIWNISPLMSSAQPPVMYTTSLWSHPYAEGAPVRLLQAQERALLRDLRVAIDKRIDNKIASARRFAVRVRNHAKMVDCYLTTYYNHKTLFGNKNLIANNIIDNPQNYHIYEGLSTLTNISRYDLPDPEMYRDFFRLNKLYNFQKLSETCTYFRGCPINKLDVAIAYDLPELVGKYKKAAEAALASIEQKSDVGSS